MITNEKLMMTHKNIVDECLKLQNLLETNLSTLIVKTARIMTPSSNSGETDNWLYMDQSYHGYDL